jgi:hypothetical protein
MLRYRLGLYQPYGGRRWAPSLAYFTIPGHACRRGSLTWNRIGETWKKLVSEIEYVEPCNFEEILNENVWWSQDMSLLGPGFSKVRGAALSRAGLNTMNDLWVSGRFLSHQEAMRKFGIKKNEDGVWRAALETIPRGWLQSLRRGPRECMKVDEWIGIFGHAQDKLPMVVFQSHAGELVSLSGVQKHWWLQLDRRVELVAPHSRCLRVWSQQDRLATADCAPRTLGHEMDPEIMCSKIWGVATRVRIVDVVKSLAKKAIKLFYGQIQNLPWDPAKFRWNRSTPFMKFTTKSGREALKKRHVIPNVAVKKWSGILPANFKFKWKNVWDKSRISKEAGMLWLVWHRAIAVNAWKGRINGNIDMGCPVCANGTTESVLHRFWECPSAVHAWKWGSHILECLLQGTRAPRRGLCINWKQGIFAYRAPRRLS